MTNMNSSEHQHLAASGEHGHAATRMIVIAIAALAIIGGALAWRIGASNSVDTAQLAKALAPARNPVLDQLVETTKALESSQQQAVDQLQVMQDMLTSQQSETRKASDRVALLNGKLDALQQSFASIPPPAAEDPVVQPRPKAQKAQRRVKVKRAPASPKAAQAGKQRTASRK